MNSNNKTVDTKNQKQWLFLRDHIFNKVFAAAGLVYETIASNKSEFDLKFSANSLYMLAHYGTEVLLASKNGFVPPEHCLTELDSGKLAAILNMLPKSLQNENLKTFNDNIVDVFSIIESGQSNFRRINN